MTPGKIRPLGVTLALAALWGAPRLASGREQLRVRASAQLVNLGLVRGAGTVEVSGGLTDEVAQPIVGGEVTLAVPESVAQRAVPCRLGDRVRVAGASVVATSDGAGFFCVRVETDTALAGAALAYSGDRYHAGTRSVVPHESGKRRLSLTFESPGSPAAASGGSPAAASGGLSASLDAPSLVVSVSARGADDTRNGEPIRLVLSEEATPNGGPETELAATDVQLGGTARFDVETRMLGAPGMGRLIARFAGSGSLAPSAESALLERHAAAHLALAAPVAPSDPEEGVEILVGASATTGAVTEGWVEAIVGGQPAGLAPVVAGAARVITTFSPIRGRPSEVTLRYVPSGGGFVGGEPLSVAVPIKPASPWLAAPWLVAGFALTYWIVRAWRRPARATRVTSVEHETLGHGRALVELVERDASHSGWRGRVIDAHEGTPVAGARVSVVVPVFDGEGIAASHVAGADGAFALVHVEAARNEGARLVVTAPFHATLSGSVPPDGVLTVCLLSRRRALLDRLVGWAAQAGRPWARRKEVTPLEIADVAHRQLHPDVARWATAVAEAAYGAKPLDERREHEIVAREPPLRPERQSGQQEGEDGEPGAHGERPHPRPRHDGGDER